MSRFADTFIALCILVVSASAGIVLRFQLGFETRDAFYAVLGLATALFFIQFWRGRAIGRRRATDIDVLSERIDAVRGELDGFGRRLAMIEGGMTRRVKDDIEPLVAEAEAMSALLRQVTETVADLDVRVQHLSSRSDPAEVVPSAPVILADPPINPPRKPASAPAQPRAAAPAPREAPAVLVPQRFSGLGEKGFLELVRRAIDANRIDIFLQPVVTLPQRKARFYECFTRLRTEEGETIYPTDYIQIAEKAGIMPALDMQIILRAVHLLRRMATRSREIGIFCNVSPTSLASPAFLRDASGFLESNRALAEVLIFEVPQEATKAMGPAEFDALNALSELGYRFSLDNVTDIRSNFTLLQARGFRFAKISAERLLSGGLALGSDIHPADLSAHFSRFGLELIVDHVESEAQVVDLLDYDLALGQGFVFSPPRPVRNEMLQGLEAAPDMPAKPAARSSAERAPVLTVPAAANAPRPPTRAADIRATERTPERNTDRLAAIAAAAAAASVAQPAREQRARPAAPAAEQQRRGPLGRAIAARQ